MNHIPRKPSLAHETINRARALLTRGNSLRHLTKALGFTTIHNELKHMTSRLEHIIDWNPIQGPLAVASAHLHFRDWHCTPEEAANRLSDELQDFLLNDQNKEPVYAKMELTISRWRGYQLRIDYANQDMFE